MQDPRAPRPAARRGTLEAATPPSIPTAPSNLIEATVRLTVADPDGKSTGTGAIVAARNGMALVITCGHLFRSSQGHGAIELSLFVPGPSGAQLHRRVAGELLDYDLDRDLAFVRFRTESPVAVTPIAPPGTPLEPGAAVTSVGCDGGDNPTVWPTRITAINRFQGHPNVEASRAPVEGRSGGGLFNAQGQLIGVCFAADPEGDEGLYASLPSIHAKLDELQLSSVYRSPLGESAGAPTPAERVAATAPRHEESTVRGQSPTVLPSTLEEEGPPDGDVATSPAGLEAAAPIGSEPGLQTLSATPPASDAAPLAGLTRAEQAALEEIARRSGGSEVICIIRPQSAAGRSDVIKLSGVSPAFIRALAASAESATPQPESVAETPRVAAETNGIAR
jgi:hypothetical protein